DLPVDIPLLEIDGLGGNELLEPIRRQLFDDRRPHLRGRRRSLCGEADEHEAERQLHAHRIEPMLAQVEIGKALLRRSREERSVVAVSPAVVRAGDAAVTPARALEQTRAAMATDVAERPNAALPLAQHDHAVGPQLEGHVVPRVPDLADVAGDLPARLEQPLELE